MSILVIYLLPTLDGLPAHNMNTRQLFIAILLASLFIMGMRETVDADMWWHLRTGEYILQHGIPQQDVFSFTVPDHEWITHEWLSQVFMWGVYQVGGLPGLMLTFAVFVVVTFGLLFACCEGRPFLAAFVVLMAAITSAIVWGARPQMFNLLLTAVFVYLVEQFRDHKIQPRWLWLLPLLTAIWANLHSGYLLGVVLLGTYTVGEGAQRWLGGENGRLLTWQEIRYLAAITAVSFLAAALNPNGPALWIYPFFTLGSQAMQVYIQEWHSPDFHQIHFWPFVSLLWLGVLSWVISAKRPTATDLLLFLGTGSAGLLSARHIPLFAIVATPILARSLLACFEKTPLYPLFSGQTNAAPPPVPMRLLNGVVLLLVLLAAGVWGVNKISQNGAVIAQHYPVTAVDYLEQNGLAQKPGYNSYNWGGYLIWRGVPVFVDGRADVYGDAFLFYYLQAYEGHETWKRPLEEFQVQYVLMERASQLSTLLANSPDWREVYADEIARIFVPHEVAPIFVPQ